MIKDVIIETGSSWILINKLGKGLQYVGNSMNCSAQLAFPLVHVAPQIWKCIIHNLIKYIFPCFFPLNFLNRSTIIINFVPSSPDFLVPRLV